MKKTNKNLIYADECYLIMGLIFKVYNEVGFGHKENFYQKAIAEIFRRNKIDFKEQVKYKLKFRGRDLGIYVLDFLVFNKIILELKQRDYFSTKDIEQLLRYLKATRLKLGIIIHFTKNGVRYKRVPNLI
jgi:GxxExxY protein